MAGKTAAEAYAHADKAHDTINAHEDLCAERYLGIRESLKDLHGTVRAARNAIVATGLALIAWLASQVYERVLDAPPPPAIVTATATSR